MVFGGDLASTRYEPGTQAYTDALNYDYQSGMLTQDQYRARAGLTPGGVVTPEMSGYIEPTSAWSSFWEGLGSAGTQLLSGYSKYQLMENQQRMMDLQVENQRRQMIGGMMGEGATPSYGGLNVYTLLMFGGIAFLAMMLLKKP